jgi:hypothetical protein
MSHRRIKFKAPNGQYLGYMNIRDVDVPLVTAHAERSGLSYEMTASISLTSCQSAFTRINSMAERVRRASLTRR